jgi:hypothetical protein
MLMVARSASAMPERHQSMGCTAQTMLVGVRWSWWMETKYSCCAFYCCSCHHSWMWWTGEAASEQTKAEVDAPMT